MTRSRSAAYGWSGWECWPRCFVLPPPREWRCCHSPCHRAGWHPREWPRSALRLRTHHGPAHPSVAGRQDVHQRRQERGVPRVDDRRVLNGILWRFRSGAPWTEGPERYGPSTTCYNRFIRWRKAGVWDRLLTAVSAGFNGELVMIDSTPEWRQRSKSTVWPAKASQLFRVTICKPPGFCDGLDALCFLGFSALGLRTSRFDLF